MARDNRIDTLKGILIVLVVLGHVITAIDNENIFNHAVMGLIYVFHMPLFILISGYLTKNPETQSSRDLWRGVFNLFISLIIFQFIYSIVRYSVTGISIWTTMKNFPYGILWYLMCLIYWRIIFYYTPKAIRNNHWLHLGIALTISILCGLSHLGHLLSIQRAMNFYFFFLLGYYYRQGVLNHQWWRNNALHLITAIILLPVIFLLFPRCGNVLNGADHYPLTGIPQKMLILMCSTAMTILVFNVVHDQKHFRAIGKDSLFYYLYHIIFISLVRPVALEQGWPHTLPFCLLYTIIIMAILFVMSKISLFRKLIRPFKL